MDYPKIYNQISRTIKKTFKDEVRKLGAVLGLPDEIIKRHPFPGPGLAIRILGEVTNEKLDCLRDVDWIVRDEIKKAGLYNEICKPKKHYYL